MSEYQYYEFLALDRPLEQSEMAALRALSTRADITSTPFHQCLQLRVDVMSARVRAHASRASTAQGDGQAQEIRNTDTRSSSFPLSSAEKASSTLP